MMSSPYVVMHRLIFVGLYGTWKIVTEPTPSRILVPVDELDEQEHAPQRGAF